MAVSPSSSVQRAREQLAERLRDIRLDAHLNARELSAAAGWHAAKTSRIESAKQAPSEDDIRAWCRVCGADRETPDLIAASRAADSMYTEWRRTQPGGLRRNQEARTPLYERTRAFKMYCSNVIPGPVQTPAYADALLSSISAFHGTPDDVADAVTARMNRNRVLRDGNHRFALLVEETVLRYRIGPPDVMAAQLSYLLDVTGLPGVTLGVIPSAAPRPVWPLETFTIFDDARVHVETLTAQITVTAPSEVVLYAKAFDRLIRLALYSTEAASLVAAAADALGLLPRNFAQPHLLGYSVRWSLLSDVGTRWWGGFAVEQAAGENAAGMGALDALRWNWGQGYDIGCGDGVWWFRRRDGRGDTEIAQGPEALRDAIIADYVARPVERILVPDELAERLDQYEAAGVRFWHDAGGWHARWPVNGTHNGRSHPSELRDLLDQLDALKAGAGSQ